MGEQFIQGKVSAVPVMGTACILNLPPSGTEHLTFLEF